MTDPLLQARIDDAKAYEALFVPALFQPWAPRVATVAKIKPGQRVLDVACGTGVLAREAAVRTGARGYVAGLDPDPGMLSVARQLAPDIGWHAGTAESLPFPDNSFDVIVSQFGLMFFTDRQQALQEMHRVLVPGGQLAIAVWDSLDNNPAYSAAVAMLDRIAGPEAANALRAPFVLGNTTMLTGLFDGLGYNAVAISTEPGKARFPSVRAMVKADIRGWLPVMGVILPEAQIAQLLGEAEHVLAPYTNEDGTVTFDSPAHIVTATRP
jgi:SAM-dependent methyltransferase